ncbi:MAG: hypothetical protein EB053_04565 [Chlamydiae bacterium]|nr:hypothetical protein [Chlamydiota bacterium]
MPAQRGPLDFYADQILNGHFGPSHPMPPLPIEELSSLRDHLKKRFESSNNPRPPLQEWVLNFFSFTDSIQINVDTPQPLDQSESDLIERVQKFFLIDLCHPNPVTLDATVFRVAFIGQYLIGQSRFTEEFLERFYHMSLEEQLYLFKKQQGLADFFKLETQIIDDLKSTGKTIKELLTNLNWIKGKKLEKILLDLAQLGPQALHQFFLVYHAEIPLLLDQLSPSDAQELLEHCEMLQRYGGHPDNISCATISAFLNDPFTSPENFFNERIRHLMDLMNQHTHGILYFETFFRDEFAYKALMLFEWIRLNPSIPFKHPVPKLTKFLIQSEQRYTRTQLHRDQFFIVPIDFPFAEFKQMDSYEMRLFIEKGLFNSSILNLFLEQSPANLKKILDFYTRSQTDARAIQMTHQRRIMRYLMDATLHPMTDYRRIFRDLEIDPLPALSSLILEKGRIGWDGTLFLALSSFFDSLEPAQQFYLMLLQDPRSQKFLYEFLQHNFHPKFGKVARILGLLENFTDPHFAELFSYFMLNKDTNEIFELLSLHPRFKGQITTFGGELLSRLYANNQILADVYYRYAETIPFDTFVKLSLIFEKDLSILSVLEKKILFNQENKTIKEHLLFLSNFSQDFYMGYFLNFLKEKPLGDGKYILFITRFFPKELDLNKILGLIPQNLIPYIALLMPPENRPLLLALRFQQTLIQSYPLFPLPIQEWLEKEVNSWIVCPLPNLAQSIERTALVSAQKELKEKRKILEELQNEVHLSLSQFSHLKNLIRSLEKSAPSSKLLHILKSIEEKNGPTMAKFQKLSKDWPNSEKAVCPFSFEFLHEPVKIKGDRTGTLIDRTFLTNLIEVKGDEKGLALWPHDPSKKFSLLDLEPANEAEIMEITSELRVFEHSLDHFFQRLVTDEVFHTQNKKQKLDC